MKTSLIIVMTIFSLCAMEQHQKNTLNQNFWKKLYLSPIVSRRCLCDIEKSLHAAWDPVDISSTVSSRPTTHYRPLRIRESQLPIIHLNAPYGLPLEYNMLHYFKDRKEQMADPLYCSECKKNWIYKTVFERHMKEKHNIHIELQYRCRICAYDFYFRHTVVEHLKLKHQRCVDETSDLIINLCD